MMTLVPKHWFSWDFALRDSVGMPWGEVGLSSWRERGTVAVGGQPYKVARSGMLGPFVLTGPSGARAAAIKESAFGQEFTLSVEERTYVLKRLSVWRREFGLFADGVRVGSIAPEAWFSRRARIDLPDQMPGWGRAFVVWLTLLLWKRDSDSSSVAAGG